MTIEIYMQKYDESAKALVDSVTEIIGDDHWFTKFLSRRLKYFRDQFRTIIVERDLE